MKKMRRAGLTMGGEPTFVSLMIPTEPNGIFTAVSTRSGCCSGELSSACAGNLRRSAHYGQGKVVSRRGRSRAGRWPPTGAKDGVPIWKDESLIAMNQKFGPRCEDAKELLSRIASVVGGDPEAPDSRYEDEFIIRGRTALFR